MVIAQVAAVPLTGIEARRGAPHLEQYFLAYLFGLGRITDHPVDEAVDGASQGVVDSFERSLVTPGHLGEQAVKILLAAALGASGFPLGYTHCAWPHALHSVPCPERMAAPGLLGSR